ncbi:UNVERIFIED_CONTAM: hypothetical protein GTU68_004657 [Idotea baltica]|nr:hypothetical protein [Idotea baltica]
MSAKLMGVTPPTPDTCRVLELGCGSGVNLISMAESLPKAKFIGVDLGGAHVKDGKKLINELGLTNVELHEQNILEIDQEWGTFDYIIAHGVYSWVPPEVQKHIFGLCEQQLSPNGIAYISFNTLPGWNSRGLVRKMIEYHLPKDLTASECLQRSREFSAHMAAGLGMLSDPASVHLADEFNRVQSAEDYYFYHEYLEEFNEALFLDEFLERADAHGLQFLGDGEIRLMLPGVGHPGIEGFLNSLSMDRVQSQNYGDIVFNRTFRKTLLCRAEQKVANEIARDAIQSFHASTTAEFAFDGRHFCLRMPDASKVDINGTAVKNAFEHLAKISPNSVSVSDLIEIAGGDESETELINALFAGVAAVPTGVIELRSENQRFGTEIQERPEVSPLARWQASRGFEAVTTRRNQSESVDHLHRSLLVALDGTKTRSQLIENVMPQIRASGVVPDSPDAELLDLCLSHFAERALLIEN